MYVKQVPSYVLSMKILDQMKGYPLWWSRMLEEFCKGWLQCSPGLEEILNGSDVDFKADLISRREKFGIVIQAEIVQLQPNVYVLAFIALWILIFFIHLLTDTLITVSPERQHLQ